MKILLLLALLAVPASSAEGGREINWRVTYAMRYKQLENSGSFLVADRSQGNSTSGGERAFEREDKKGVTASFHKETALVNCTAAGHPGKTALVWMECELMLNGPGEAFPRTGTRSGLTSIFKTAVYLKKGRKTAVLEEPDRRFELTVDEAPFD